MKKILCILGLIIGAGFVICFIVLAIYSSRAKEPPREILARVNDYVMTVKDFKDEIKYSPYAGDDTLDMQNLLDLAVRRELLIQEAQRQGLDREKTFMKTIERHWKQTLIKELLDKETQRIYKSVSEDKQQEAMSDWMEKLIKEADIEIHKEVLEELKKGNR